MPEGYYERDEPISNRDMEEPRSFDYDYNNFKAASGFEEGGYFEGRESAATMYSTVNKHKTSTSSRYDKDDISQYGSEDYRADQPKHGIIRRPDSRSSKNVTFDAAPAVQDTGAEIQEYDSSMQPSGDQSKQFLNAMTKGFAAPNTGTILQTGFDSVKYLLKKGNQGIRTVIDKVGGEMAQRSKQQAKRDQQQMFDELFGHVEPYAEQTQGGEVMEYLDPRSAQLNQGQQKQGQLQIQNQTSDTENFKKTLEKKMYEYTNPENIQLSPIPQRDLFTGQRIEPVQDGKQTSEAMDRLNEVATTASYVPERQAAIETQAAYQYQSSPSMRAPENLPAVLKLDHIQATDDYYPPVPPSNETAIPVKESVRQYVMDTAREQTKPSRPVATSDNILPGNKQLNVRRTSYIQDVVELRRRELKEKKAWIQNGMMGAMGFCVMMYLQSVETYSYM